jgi:hypothetical protein
MLTALRADGRVMSSYGLQRVALIKQVHSILSASAKASFSGNTNAIVSSLVLGDDFIHSYHFGLGDEDSSSFLILQTYSRHGNTCYGRMYMGNVKIVKQTQGYLRVSHASR